MSPVASSIPPAVTSGGLLTSPTSATSMATVTPGCTWSAWDNGSCSVTCGTGVYSRHRVCLDANHGVCNTCGQNSTMTGCTWSAWDNGSCSVTCGTGVYSRHRVCLDANHSVCNTCGQNSTMTGTRPCFYPNCQ
ncbi:unnamed protein product [Adineta steineri]|uniref:Uncharacterized protein n=1 Tax=Adineta steineri TaxID=433720 RepID=A0A814TCW2_9BILA|nr:unnamed protein product [Adineta steineri]